jgi:hypothetical protein
MTPYIFDSGRIWGYAMVPSAGGEGGWRWMNHEELRDIHAAVKKSYVLRPFYARRGDLDLILTPDGGNLDVMTAIMHRVIPLPHELIPYPRDGQVSRAVVQAVNRVLPVAVSRFESLATAAVVDTGRPLPAVDLLPAPMRWTTPLRIHGRRKRLLPWLPMTFGRPRNLPSGAPLKPVPLAKPDQDYFAPLAPDPEAAAKALSPALLTLTRELKVAWWSEGTVLFVWTHDALPFDRRTVLAEQAKLIHSHLVGKPQVA